MNVVTLSDLRSDLPSLIKQVAGGLQRFVVTVSGKPKAVLLSLEEVEALEETADVLASTDLSALRRGVTQAQKGQGIPLSQL